MLVALATRRGTARRGNEFRHSIIRGPVGRESQPKDTSARVRVPPYDAILKLVTT